MDRIYGSLVLLAPISMWIPKLSRILFWGRIIGSSHQFAEISVFTFKNKCPKSWLKNHIFFYITILFTLYWRWLLICDTFSAIVNYSAAYSCFTHLASFSFFLLVNNYLTSWLLWVIFSLICCKIYWKCLFVKLVNEFAYWETVVLMYCMYLLCFKQDQGSCIRS